MNEKEQFIKEYNKVFDENGNVRPCGRKHCENLINLAYLIDKKNARLYGNPRTGFMNIENIQQLYKEIS